MRFVRSYGFRSRVPWEPSGDSMTEQSHRDLVDVNQIVQRFQRTGQLPPASSPPSYADVTRLQTPLLERIAFAEAVFAAEAERVAASPDEAVPVPPVEPVTA